MGKYIKDFKFDDGSIWDFLKLFWDDDKVETWLAALVEDGTESLRNQITMSPSVYSAWGSGLFALRPVKESVEERCMDVQFYWLPRGSPCRESRMDISNLTDAPHLPANLPNGHGTTKFWNSVTEEKIVSGTVIELVTLRPNELPLPSVDLLEMQWYLHRVMAITGAGEPDDYDDDELPTFEDYCEAGLPIVGYAEWARLREGIPARQSMVY